MDETLRELLKRILFEREKLQFQDISKARESESENENEILTNMLKKMTSQAIQS